MNVIELKPSSMYPQEGATYSTKAGDIEYHTAYIVVGRTPNGQALVVEGTGANELVAIDACVRKLKVLGDYLNVAAHMAFWAAKEREKAEGQSALRRLFGGALETKKDDEGNLS